MNRNTTADINDSDEMSVLELQHSLKSTAYKNTLLRIRTKLGPVERLFSKFIHNQSVDKVSTLLATTIVRPSGMVGGSVFLLFTTVVVLAIERVYGYSYNPFLFVLGFGVGFAGGLILEMLGKLAKKSRL
jgi:hypothetical protein